jgi:hypothetical protein
LTLAHSWNIKKDRDYFFVKLSHFSQIPGGITLTCLTWQDLVKGWVRNIIPKLQWELRAEKCVFNAKVHAVCQKFKDCLCFHFYVLPVTESKDSSRWILWVTCTTKCQDKVVTKTEPLHRNYRKVVSSVTWLSFSLFLRCMCIYIQFLTKYFMLLNLTTPFKIFPLKTKNNSWHWTWLNSKIRKICVLCYI